MYKYSLFTQADRTPHNSVRIMLYAKIYSFRVLRYVPYDIVFSSSLRPEMTMPCKLQSHVNIGEKCLANNFFHDRKDYYHLGYALYDIYKLISISVKIFPFAHSWKSTHSQTYFKP